MGTDGLNFGVNVATTITMDHVSITAGTSFGMSQGDIGTGASGFRQGGFSRVSYTYSGGNSLSFGHTHYRSGESTQKTWLAGFQAGRFSMYTQNDVGIAGGDQYRTAALELGWDAGQGATITAGFKVFTGVPDREFGVEKYTNLGWLGKGAGRNEYYANPEASKYQAGIGYVGVRYNGQQVQVGRNSPEIQHYTQNLFHTIMKYIRIPGTGIGMTSPPHFVTNFPPSSYFNYQSYSPFSLY